MTVADKLREAAEIFEQRNKEYGDGYKNYHNIFTSLFDGAVQIEDSEDYDRLFLIKMIVSKLHRYCTNFNKGGHADSIIDLVNYAAMLSDLDEELKNLDEELKNLE